MLKLPYGRTHVLAALAGGLFVVSLLAACSEGDAATPAPRSEVEAQTTTAEPAFPTPTLVLSLDRFQYTATLTVREARLRGEAKDVAVSTEGSFQSPDRHSFTYTTRIGAGQTSESAVLIGDDAWLRHNDQAWRETARDDAEVARVLSFAFSAVRPGFLGSTAFDQMRESLRHITPIEEDVNGVPADHYVVGPEGQEFFQTFIADPAAAGQDLHWELWLARDGGWPARLLVSGRLDTDTGILQKLGLTAPATWELRIDISRPNDPALSVHAPQ